MFSLKSLYNCDLRFFGSLITTFDIFSIVSVGEILSTDSSQIINDLNCSWKDLRTIWLSVEIWVRSKTDFTFKNVTNWEFLKFHFKVLRAVAQKLPFLFIKVTVRFASQSSTLKLPFHPNAICKAALIMNTSSWKSSLSWKISITERHLDLYSDCCYR